MRRLCEVKRASAVGITTLALAGVLAPAGAARSEGISKSGGATRSSATLKLIVNFFINGTVTVTLPDGSPVGTTSGAPTLIPAGYYTIFEYGPGGCAQLPFFSITGHSTKIFSDMTGGEIDTQEIPVYFPPNSTFTWRVDNAQAVVNHMFSTSSDIQGTLTVPKSGTTGKGAGAATSSDIVGSSAIRGTVNVSITSAGKVAVTLGSKPVVRLAAGRYVFRVSDLSTRIGLTLEPPKGKVIKLTDAAFRGTNASTVNLTAGRWSAVMGGAKKLSFTIR